MSDKKVNLSKDKQEKPTKQVVINPAVPKRPEPNVTRAQKSVDVEDLKKKGNSNGENN